MEPDILEPVAVKDAVYHQGQPLELGLPTGPAPVVVDYRARNVLLQLLVDVPHQRLALLLIGLGGLLVKQLLQLGIAIAGIVRLRAATVIFIKLLVGVVDPAAGQIEADLIVRIVIGRDIACRNLYIEPLFRSVDEFLHELSCFRPVLFDIGVIADHGFENIRRHSPNPDGQR